MRTRVGLAALATILVTAIPVGAQAASSDPGYSLTAVDGTPLAGAAVGSPFTMRLAFPAGTAISKVKFLIDNTYVGEDTTAPFEWTTYVTPGARGLKARATTPSGDRQALATVTAALTPLPAEPAPLPDPVGPFRAVPVATVAELAAAIGAAQPGDVIALADGVYETDALTATADGTPDQPIILTGSRDAVITSDDGYDGGSPALRLDNADWWRITGLTIRDAKKGLILDGSDHTLISGVLVEDIGHEGIHLRRHSSDNWVVGNTVRRTGLANDGYGETLYVGSAVSNWCTYTTCLPDRADRNTLVGNTLTEMTAEAVDIKEGTTGGVVAGNTIDGSSISGGNSADSWIDVKGNAWTIRDNTATNSPGNGIEIHVAVNGWGGGTWITGNTLAVNGPGVGVALVPAAAPMGTIIGCDNTVTGAAGGPYETTSGAPYPCTTQ